MAIMENWIELTGPKIPQIANGIIWLIGDFRLTVKKGKGPNRGLFSAFVSRRLRQESIRSRYLWTVGKADRSQCGFWEGVAANEDAFAASGAP